MGEPSIQRPHPRIERAPCFLVCAMPSTRIVLRLFDSHESGILKAMQLRSETRIRSPDPKRGVFCYPPTVDRPCPTGPRDWGGQRCFLSCSRHILPTAVWSYRVWAITHWSFQGRWPETLLAVSGGFWEMMRLCEEPDQVTSSPFWCRMIFV